MAIEIRVPTEDDLPGIFASDGRAFGFHWSEEDAGLRRPTIDLPRFRIACDGRGVVGLGGTIAFDLTVPGGSTIPAGGLTWVGVSATHRRQGVLTGLLDAIHADSRDRGDAVAILHASEAAIYGRFGYGIATREREVRIDLQRTRLRDDCRGRGGEVRYVDGDEAFAHYERLWERFRRMRPGELSRSPQMNAVIRAVRSKELGEAGAAFHLAHCDGFASYRVVNKWDDAHPQTRVDVVEMVTLTADAHLALWGVLLSLDLVATVTSRFLPPDDPLPYFVTNPRAVFTTAQHDGLWLLPFDVATAFGARTYGTTDRLVIEVDGVRFAIDGTPAGADVRAVRSRPDLTVDADAVGALLLGGIRAGELAAAGKVRARSADVLRRADRFLLADVAPCSTTLF